MLRVTIDTNVIDDAETLRAACDGLAIELTHTTVTDRELETSDIVVPPAGLVESGVWGESPWGQFVWGDDASTRFEAIVQIISNGSFPPLGKRGSLTPPQKRQLRDALILETHAREGRDVLVTNDEVGFIRHGRRERLESLCATRIRTVDEFCRDTVCLARKTRRSAFP